MYKRQEINYENLKSNTKYTIEITGNVQLGNTQENIPVSYTHLDVYKRQELERVDIKDKLGVLDIKAIINENITVNICLLYTSRCV